jgi:hypothetical protein
VKTLIGIINCHARPAYQQAVRDTWLPLLPAGVDYRFFLGPSERTPKDDEVFLECDDSYQGLPSKVQAMCRWALDHGYDFGAKLDDDVILLPKKFLASGFEQHDFTGHKNDDRDFPAPWGFLYVMSRRAMEIVVNAPLPRNNNDEVFVSHALSEQGIPLHHDPRYFLHRGKIEDFVELRKRPLRAPPRIVTMRPPIPFEGTFAWCLYITWLGYRNLPEEKNIAEFHRLFKEVNR